MNRRKSADKVILGIVIFVITILIIGIAVMCILGNQKNKNDNDKSNDDGNNTNITSNIENVSGVWQNLDISHKQDLYECLTEQSKTENGGYLIYYPDIKNKDINADILSVVDEFKKSYSDNYSNGNNAFFVDYKTYLSNNNLLTVVFSNTVIDEDKNIKNNNISTYTYKIDSSTKLTQSDIFKNSFYIYVKDKVLEELENKNINVSDDSVAFDNIAFDNEYCYLLYSAYQLGLNAVDTITIKIDNNDIKNYLKINLDGTEIKTETNRIRENLDPDKPMIALTFDDGPSYLYTSDLLDAVENYDIRVTFFMVGYNIPGNGSIIKRAYDLGCQIANHTENHSSLTSLSVQEMINEVEGVNNKLKDVIGTGASMVRPPYGSYNSDVKANINYPLILWNVDTEDWRTRNADLVEQAILSNAFDGAIMLLHDIHSTSVEGAVRAIPQLIQQGYQLVTVEELLYYKGIDVQPGHVYS